MTRWAGIIRIAADAVSRLLQYKDEPHYNTVDDVRDDIAPLTELEQAAYVLQFFPDDGKIIVDAVDRFREHRAEQLEKAKKKVFDPTPVTAADILKDSAVDKLDVEVLTLRMEMDLQHDFRVLRGWEEQVSMERVRAGTQVEIAGLTRIAPEERDLKRHFTEDLRRLFPAEPSAKKRWFMLQELYRREERSQRLYSKPVGATAEFDISIPYQNWVIDEVAGDGNFLFRAVSKQLYGVETSHNMLRKRVMMR